MTAPDPLIIKIKFIIISVIIFLIFKKKLNLKNNPIRKIPEKVIMVTTDKLKI